jgi:tryptophan 2,3-dioxygenase
MSTQQPNVYGESDLTYNTYLRVPELLELQVPESDPPHHDEMLFIIIHQAYELWFKLILHEVGRTMQFMDDAEPLKAHHHMNRVVEIMRLLVQQIHILETMRPVDFLQFRDRLNPASGFQSLQFRELEFAAGLKDDRYLRFFQNRPEMLSVLERRLKEPTLRDKFYNMLAALGYDLPANLDHTNLSEADKTTVENAVRTIYQNPETNLGVYLLAESLVSLDQHLQLWREHHVRVVARVIGSKFGTGGSSGIEYLKGTTMKQCFPLLWSVRTDLEK